MPGCNPPSLLADLFINLCLYVDIFENSLDHKVCILQILRVV